jgi:hypothetical protein
MACTAGAGVVVKLCARVNSVGSCAACLVRCVHHSLKFGLLRQLPPAVFYFPPGIKPLARAPAAIHGSTQLAWSVSNRTSLLNVSPVVSSPKRNVRTINNDTWLHVRGLLRTRPAMFRS